MDFTACGVISGYQISATDIVFAYIIYRSAASGGLAKWSPFKMLALPSGVCFGLQANFVYEILVALYCVILESFA